MIFIKFFGIINIESQKTSLTRYQTMYDEAIKNNETRKAEVYGSRVEKIKRRIKQLLINNLNITLILEIFLMTIKIKV